MVYKDPSYTCLFFFRTLSCSHRDAHVTSLLKGSQLLLKRTLIAHSTLSTIKLPSIALRGVGGSKTSMLKSDNDGLIFSI